MSKLIKIDNEYKTWILDIERRYRTRQIKSAVLVNQEMLKFYWSIGKDIVEKKAESKWGSGFFNNLSKDMKTLLPDVKGLASSNLRYMKKFYEIYHKAIFPQVVGKLGKDVVGLDDSKNIGKLSEQELFSIPWGHHRIILDKCKGNIDKSIFFIRKTISNNWSRAVLLNFLDTDLFEREGKAITNFEYSLPVSQSDLAQEITKDPYNFDFLAIREDYDEKGLKDALIDNIIKFLLELGKGFAFVGREYIIPIEGTEEKIDLLFYHLHLHCYIVVEVKIVPFTPRDIGQIGTYVNIVDALIRTEIDSKTIGLIICKSKNNVLAKYAVNSSKEPIGISEYELSNLLPAEYKDAMPSIEEIEQELMQD